MNKQPWDTCLETCGKRKLADFLGALVITQSTMTCSFRMTDSPQLDTRSSIWFRVHVPVDSEEQFEQMGGCKLDKIPRIQVGMHTDPGYPYQGAFAKKPEHKY